MYCRPLGQLHCLAGDEIVPKLKNQREDCEKGKGDCDRLAAASFSNVSDRCSDRWNAATAGGRRRNPAKVRFSAPLAFVLLLILTQCNLCYCLTLFSARASLYQVLLFNSSAI